MFFKCDFVDAIELGNAFDVEAPNACLQCRTDVFAAFADARIDDVAALGPGQESAGEFAAADDIETNSGTAEKLQQCQRAVCFHRIENAVRGTGDACEPACKCRFEGFMGINVKRSAEARGQIRQFDVFTVKFAGSARETGQSTEIFSHERKSEE